MHTVMLLSPQSRYKTFASSQKVPSGPFAVNPDGSAPGNRWSGFCPIVLPFPEYLTVGSTTCSPLTWLLSLSMIHFRYIHVAEIYSLFFLLLLLMYGCATVYLSINQLKDIWVSSIVFLRGVIISKAAINIQMQIFVWLWVSFLLVNT